MTALSLMMYLVLACTCGFAFLNGFRDASNSVAAAVRTRALTPTYAVLVASFFTFVGTMLSTSFGVYLISAVELNVPDGTPGLTLLLAALLAAGAWGILCWWRGLPISSTHALISALAGASGASAFLGDDGVHDSLRMLFGGVLLPLVFTPLVAFAFSYLLVVPATWLVRHSSAADVNGVSRAGQAVAACAVALGHGIQDGQRTGAMLTLTLVTAHAAQPGSIMLGTQLLGATFLSAGVLFGGWRIAHTIAYRLVSLDPLRGMIAQSVSATMLFLGAMVFHLPLSTTQAVTSSIVGAGANQRFESVIWRNVNRVLRHWVATPVVCALLAGVLLLAMHPLLG
ncbi:inorganic phosphate transporter [Paeniglutamicibacter kerguelensis]|uniref:PiT family inorganic phosphate transporter n=1 Tax=Paeniglutamicibacter kerguelensis TaxID=254788 RepID=A0ABS4XKG7_9MICC|nr:inorganic phosphate transporter [Paeniglutamicibacter kerguelensis]MBP2388826.1 PiT family inorganic phosphate transporter [Paeniglutamicibacter kerguelensis]